jgi:amino acid transporter
MGILYVLLSLTFAEMSSAVPFAGGSFGYVRCTLGPFWGYLVGASELLENFVFVCACVRSMGISSTIAWEVQTNFDARPKTFPVFYTALFLVNSIGGTFYWRSVMFFGLYAIGIVMMFLIISYRDYDLNHYAFYKMDEFEGEPRLFLRRLHYLMGAYMGLQIMPLLSERIIDVRKNLPIALVTCTTITFVTEMLIVVAASGVNPGMSSKMFKTRCPMCFSMLENMDLDIKHGNLISMFLMWTLAMGYFYSCGHQMHAMAMSGLLPSVLRKTWGPNNQPVLCFLISAVMQCAACVWMYYKFPLLLILKIVCIGASFVYLAMFAAYIIFRTRFKNMQREFYSPFGIPGAVLGMLMGFGLWIATMFFQEDFNAMSIYLVYIGGNVVFYFAYVQHNQFFSEEEQNKFMKAYVMNGKATVSGVYMLTCGLMCCLSLMCEQLTK